LVRRRGKIFAVQKSHPAGPDASPGKSPSYRTIATRALCGSTITFAPTGTRA
jgi:hypothetical protein